jgi:hypothetical protein
MRWSLLLSKSLSQHVRPVWVLPTMDATGRPLPVSLLDEASDRLGVESRPARIVNEKSALGPPCQLDTRAGWPAFGSRPDQCRRPHN